MKNAVKYWLLVAIIVSGLCGLVYAVAQQVIRQGADDPQIAMAEGAAAQLASGQSPQSVIPANKIDLATSVVPFMIIFDSTGKPLASSALLNGQIPTIPAGVFDVVQQRGEDRITWQPQPDVRSAIVVTRFKGANSGFVLAGRSLRDVEVRENNILYLTLVAWIVLLVVTFAVIVLLVYSDKLFRPTR